MIEFFARLKRIQVIPCDKKIKINKNVECRQFIIDRLMDLIPDSMRKQLVIKAQGITSHTITHQIAYILIIIKARNGFTQCQINAVLKNLFLKTNRINNPTDLKKHQHQQENQCNPNQIFS